MTAIKFVPISLDVATGVLGLLRYASGLIQHRDEAVRLTAMVGEAISIAGDHVDASEMLCSELLELIGRVSGRELSTIPGPNSLAEAEEALSDLAPVLGKVLELPRAANADPRAVDAAAARALADMPGPISMRPLVEKAQRPRQTAYDELDPVDVWAVPRTGEPWCGYIVRGVEWDSPKSVRLMLAAKPAAGDIAF
jgi:hypothetical protein